LPSSPSKNILFGARGGREGLPAAGIQLLRPAIVITLA
jgi:hypothetical protein